MVARFSGEWREVKFNDVITPKARIGWQGLRKDEYLRSGYSYLISGTDFHNGTISLDNIWQVSKARYDMDRNIQVAEGDVLVTKDGTIGKVALVPKLSKPATLNSGVFVFRTHHGLAQTFLFRVLQSSIFRNFINTLAAGSTIKHLYQKNLCDFSFMLPPLDEQLAIADTLSAFDRHLSDLSELIAKKKAIRQGALEELVAQHAAGGGTSGRTRLSGFSGEWREAALGEIVVGKLSYGINAPAVPYEGRNPAYIRITDITEDGRYNKDGKVSVVVSPFEREKYRLRDGDIVLARTGSVGRSYLYDSNDGELIYAGYLIKASIDCKKCDPRYVAYHFHTARYWSWVAKMSKRSAQSGINSKEYASFVIPLPPLDEQLAIADTLSALDTEISALTAEHSKLSAIRQAAINDLLSGKIRLAL